MKNIIILSVLYLYVNVILADPKMKDYFIEYNAQNCSLLSLSADITVTYDTNQGVNSVKLSLENATNAQEGTCGDDGIKNKAQFNITINDYEKLIFDFENVNGTVILRDVMVIYDLASKDFPNATHHGLITSATNINKDLSFSNQYYQCFSRSSLSLSNNVSVNIYGIKVKVFNVVNSSFGKNMSQCPQDLLTTTSIVPGTTEQSSTPTTNPSTATTMFSTTSVLPTTTNIITTGTTEQPSNSTSTTNPSNATTMFSTTSFIPTTTNIRTTVTTEQPSNSTSTTNPSNATTMFSSTSMKPVTSTSDYTNNSTSSSTTSTFSSQTPLLTTISPNDPKFSVNDSTEVCLLLQSKMTLNVTYDTTLKNGVVKEFPVTSSNKYIGVCSPNEDNITIYYSTTFYFILSFTKKDKLVKLNSFRSSILLSKDFFPDAKQHNITLSPPIVSFGSLYEVALGNTYSCSSSLTLGVTPSELIVKDFKFEAFRTTKTEDFSSKVTDCKRDPIVAIIVGVVLAVFLIIVVIIFVIFQIRARRRQGYQEI